MAKNVEESTLIKFLKTFALLIGPTIINRLPEDLRQGFATSIGIGKEYYQMQREAMEDRYHDQQNKEDKNKQENNPGEETPGETETETRDIRYGADDFRTPGNAHQSRSETHPTRVARRAKQQAARNRIPGSRVPMPSPGRSM